MIGVWGSVDEIFGDIGARNAIVGAILPYGMYSRAEVSNIGYLTIAEILSTNHCAM